MRRPIDPRYKLRHESVTLAAHKVGIVFRPYCTTSLFGWKVSNHFLSEVENGITSAIFAFNGVGDPLKVGQAHMIIKAFHLTYDGHGGTTSLVLIIDRLWQTSTGFQTPKGSRRSRRYPSTCCATATQMLAFIFGIP